MRRQVGLEHGNHKRNNMLAQIIFFLIEVILLMVVVQLFLYRSVSFGKALLMTLGTIAVFNVLIHILPQAGLFGMGNLLVSGLLTAIGLGAILSSICATPWRTASLVAGLYLLIILLMSGIHIQYWITPLQ